MLTPELVLFIREATDKYRLIETLVRRLAQNKPGLDAESLLNKVIEREEGLSTTLDTGLSIPHARVDGLSEILASLAVVPAGVQDPHPTNIQIRVVLLFFSPNDPQFFQTHLRFLQSVSKLFQPSLIAQLAASSTSEQALDLLKKAEN